MATHTDYWKIRFGQWFEAALQASGRKLQDNFYFWPDDLKLDEHDESNYQKIDLNHNTAAYNENFAKGLTISPMNEIAADWNVTLVIVPGVGHHLLKNKVLQNEMGWLKSQGLKVLYGYYGDSFESVDKCARRLYETISRESTTDEKLVFLSYSKGCPVSMALLTDENYKDIRQRTLALVGLSTPIRGTSLASAKLARIALKLLQPYKTYFSKTVRRFIRLIGRLTGWVISIFHPSMGRKWREAQQQVLEFEDEITDLPEGIIGLTRKASDDRFEKVRLDPAISLFTLSAVYPPSDLKANSRKNPEDFFLYLVSLELYEHTVFCDSQVALHGSRFYPANGEARDLGILRADHWGVTMEYVFSEKYPDPFPRREMVWALCATLKEYFKLSDK